jgi:3D (Asp-Asp-Asp) domain-containing protein
LMADGMCLGLTDISRAIRIFLFSVIVLPTLVSIAIHRNTQSETLKPEKWISLGKVRVTSYTHNEGGRVTAYGYILRDEDAQAVCAVSRDWWRKFIKPGDLVWVEGMDEPCIVLDTMATHNRKGLAQTRWVDIYMNNVRTALDFGIQRRQAWLLPKIGRSSRYGQLLYHPRNLGMIAPVRALSLASRLRL